MADVSLEMEKLVDERLSKELRARTKIPPLPIADMPATDRQKTTSPDLALETSWRRYHEKRTVGAQQSRLKKRRHTLEPLRENSEQYEIRHVMVSPSPREKTLEESLDRNL